MKLAVLLLQLDALQFRLTALEQENALLKQENTLSKERLHTYENPKNSRNSSTAPSKDENRPKRNQSLQ